MRFLELIFQVRKSRMPLAQPFSKSVSTCAALVLNFKMYSAEPNQSLSIRMFTSVLHQKYNKPYALMPTRRRCKCVCVCDGGYVVPGYPTVLLFRYGVKATPVPYEGDRSPADLIKFLCRHAQHSKLDEDMLLEELKRPLLNAGTPNADFSVLEEL